MPLNARKVEDETSYMFYPQAHPWKQRESSRHLVLVKTQLGTVYTHQEFKYEVIDIHSLLLQRPSHPRVIQ